MTHHLHVKVFYVRHKGIRAAGDRVQRAPAELRAVLVVMQAVVRALTVILTVARLPRQATPLKTGDDLRVRRCGASQQHEQRQHHWSRW